LITYRAEYDALPGIGHACGHNLNATSSLAAFLATAEAIQKNQIKGRVRLLGTPAEEGGGGKIELLKAGVYRGMDACLMGHPVDRLQVGADGLVTVPSMALVGAKVTFQWKKCPCWKRPLAWSQCVGRCSCRVHEYLNALPAGPSKPANSRYYF
jgi:metal-dependent amidase/aminoacylase/carboxypeptidase family protein